MRQALELTRNAKSDGGDAGDPARPIGARARPFAGPTAGRKRSIDPAAAQRRRSADAVEPPRRPEAANAARSPQPPDALPRAHATAARRGRDALAPGQIFPPSATAPRRSRIAQGAACRLRREGAAYLARTFACEAGSRDYKVYVPSGAEGRTLPLVVMLHGCTQNPDDFAVGTGMNRLAEERGFIVAYPGQPCSANPSTCWNWFDPSDQMRDQGEPASSPGSRARSWRIFSSTRRGSLWRAFRPAARWPRS